MRRGKTKRKKTNCRHLAAWPTVFGNICGYLWCPDCGAIRYIEEVKDNQITKLSKRWIYPTGADDVITQLEAAEGVENETK